MYSLRRRGRVSVGHEVAAERSVYRRLTVRKSSVRTLLRLEELLFTEVLGPFFRETLNSKTLLFVKWRLSSHLTPGKGEFPPSEKSCPY